MATIEIQEDPESKELFIELPDDLIQQVKWEIGDTVEWIDNKNGSWTIKKVDKDRSV